jgi:hypothetical protein
MLGNEPLEEEIPRGREDLTLDTQLVFELYDKLPAKWDSMTGSYLGKDLSILNILVKFYKLERCEIYYTWSLIPIIDSFVAEDIARKIKSKGSITGDMPRGSN